jgi:DNA-binding HxlR family transcriptional regulator
MAESKSDLILHPIRMRIIQSLINGGRKTTQQIAERMPDIPQATMYRHLSKLHAGKIIEVVEQNQVRGTTEKVYALAEHGGELTLQELDQMNREDHMALFMKFAATLIGDFGTYLQQPDYNLVKDGVSFRQVQLYLTDEEYLQMLGGIREQFQRYIENEPEQGRRRRVITTVILPDGR